MAEIEEELIAPASPGSEAGETVASELIPEELVESEEGAEDARTGLKLSLLGDVIEEVEEEEMFGDAEEEAGELRPVVTPEHDGEGDDDDIEEEVLFQREPSTESPDSESDEYCETDLEIEGKLSQSEEFPRQAMHYSLFHPSRILCAAWFRFSLGHLCRPDTQTSL